MVRHIVMYKLKESTEENKKALVDVFRSMRDNISVLKELESGANYAELDRAYDVVLVTAFDSKDDFEAYRTSDYHQNVVVKYVHSVISDSKSVDYVF